MGQHSKEDETPEEGTEEVTDETEDENPEEKPDYGQRLHTELVRATGRLADPSDLPFDAEHLDDPEKLAAAIDALLAKKPHLKKIRKPAGNAGQGERGITAVPADFSQLFKH